MPDDATPDPPTNPPTSESRPDASGADPEAPHSDDGLDVARWIAAATAAAPGAEPRARRRGGGARGGLGGSSAGGGAGRGSRSGAGPRLSGAHPDDRDPQLVGGELRRLVDERGWELPLRLRGVFARWAEIVGAEVADHCTPESFADGRLSVRTDSTAWATQLRLLAPQLVQRLNADLGPGTVTVVEVAGPQAPSWKRGPRSVRGRGPRDTYG